MKSHRLLIAISLASLAVMAVPAKAQLATGNEFATQTPGKNVVGTVDMCLNASNVAVPCTGAAAGYSTLATPVANAASGTTGPVSISIPAVAAKTSYVCGFEVSAVGGTTQFAVTVAGLKGPSGAVTFTYQMSASAGGAVLMKTFTPCIPANAANSPIPVATGAAAGATAVNVNVSGYQQ